VLCTASLILVLCICEVQLCMFLWQKRLRLTLLSSAAHRFNSLSPISAFTADDVLQLSVMEPICVLNWHWRGAAQVMSPFWFLLFYVLLFAFCHKHVYKLQFGAFISLPVACFIVKESLCLDLSALDSNFCANAATYLPFLLGFAK